MLQLLLLLPEAAARAALDRHRLRLQALRPGADGAGGGLVDVSAGLQRPPSPLPQTGPFPAASPPLLLACVLRGAISTDPTPISHRSRTDLAPIPHRSRTDLAPISHRSRPFSRCTNPGPHGARCDLVRGLPSLSPAARLPALPWSAHRRGPRQCRQCVSATVTTRTSECLVVRKGSPRVWQNTASVFLAPFPQNTRWRGLRALHKVA